MKPNMQNRCREKNILSLISTKLSVSTLYLLSLSISIILPLLPALFSCSTLDNEVETRISLTRSEVNDCLDVFTFNNDRMESLDSYQHWDRFSGQDIGIRSQNGEKHVFICANGQREKQDWAGINSSASLEGIQIDLRNERREALCMTGEAKVKAGTQEYYQVMMRRIASEVRVNSLCCDFTGKSYEGEYLDDIQIYLTNVNVRCSITADGAIMPVEIINAGNAYMEDIATFRQPDMIFQEITGSVGKEKRELDIGLLCYPNASVTESPGTPFTRLVIQGRLEGETYWWPIDINREKDSSEPGIYRNRQYIYDICLTRKGSDDPDHVIETDAAKIKTSVRSWTEKEGYQVVY